MLQMGREAQARFDAPDSPPNPLEHAARGVKIPTLLIRGARSQIVTEAGVREFMELVPHAEYVDIADAHHMVAGDANDQFNDAVFTFVDKQAMAQRAG
jgi:pimeloyl-ACP methyl ester carboxylesterase